jgi:hypothetical protein
MIEAVKTFKYWKNTVVIRGFNFDAKRLGF